MALSGDIEAQEVAKTVGIRLESQIWFTNEGQVTYIYPSDEDITFDQDLPHEVIQELIIDRSKHHLSKVIEVVDGDLESALPLIGHRMPPMRPNERGLRDMLSDGLLTETDEVKDQITALGPRNPASLLVVHENNIYGVIIDEKNDCRVVGRVREVIPKRDPQNRANTDYNTVIVGKEAGMWSVAKSRDHDLKNEVENGIIFCIISEGGFAFIEGNDIPDENLKELVLIVNRGYIFFKEVPIDWMRLMIGLRIDEFAVRTTTVQTKECIVTHRGGYLRYGDRIQVNGSLNAILDFEAFLKFLNAMGTVGFQPGGQTAQIEEQAVAIEDNPDDDQSTERSDDEVSELEDGLSAINMSDDFGSEPKDDSLDSDYDNISPDSFS